MDKKKVKIHIENVSKILGTKRETLSTGNLEHLQNELKLALIELNKSDWISVKEEPAPSLKWRGSWNDEPVKLKDE